MFDPHQIYHKMIVAGEEWAELDYAAQLLEETRKSVLAKLANDEIAKAKDKLSQASAESKARATEAYREHIKAMVEARREANKAKVRYDSCKELSNNRRTQESTRRAEMTIR